MKILMILPQYKPLVGGYERAGERLSNALAGHCDEVTVITERRYLEWEKKEIIENVKILRWSCIYKPHLHIITSTIGMCILLLRKGLNYNVWHVHQYGVHAAIAIAIGKILQRPVVLKLTSSEGMGLKKTLSNVRFKSLAIYLHTKVSAVIALTKETADEAKEFGIENRRISIIGNGIDTEKYKPINEKKRESIKNNIGIIEKRIIIFVGRLSVEKNVEGIINAWQRVNNKTKKEWTLLIVGDGPQRYNLNEMIKKFNLKDSVVFVGFRNDISECMAAADMYVSFSNNEGLSNSLLEAMSSGLPVVASRVSGVKELVEKTGSGIAVDIGDIKALANAIETMTSNNGLRKKASENARSYILGNYSIENIMKKHIELYRSVIK
jgi:glycosyltransferase involved in cell wall biosynthesis